MENEITSTIGPDPFTSKKHKEEIEVKARASQAAWLAAQPDPQEAEQRELNQRRADAHKAALVDVMNDKISEASQATREGQTQLSEVCSDSKAGIDRLFTVWQEVRETSAHEAKLRHELGNYSGNVSVLVDRLEATSFSNIVEMALTARTQNHVKTTWDTVAKAASDAGNKAVDSITE